MATVQEDFAEPSAPAVPFQWFKSALLHRVSEESVAEVCEQLKEENVLLDKGWTAMRFENLKATKKATKSMIQEAVSPNSNRHHLPPVEEPEAATDPDVTVEMKDTANSEANLNENTFFKPLPDIFNHVLAIVRKKGVKTRIRFFSAPAWHAFKSEENQGHFKSDMVALVEPSVLAKGEEDKTKRKRKRGEEDTAKEEYQCDVVLAAEFKFKVSESDIDNNVSKLLGNASHIMGSDPSRRFLYGMTIEHTNVRLCFFSRSHIFVTEILDLRKNARDIVYLILALGTASDEALGFDPTVERILSATTGKIGYCFAVDGEAYEVIEVINIYKATFLLGRANRIFRVKRVLLSGELDNEVKVMKDLWISQDAKTELEMRQHIYDNFGKNPVEGLDRAMFDKHFVVIEKCVYVKVPSMLDPNILVDDTSTNFLRDHEIPEHSRFLLKRTTIKYKQFVSHSMCSSLTVTPGSYYPYRAGTGELKGMTRRCYRNKVHCRILMEDAGKPLLEVSNLQELVLCVIQAITGLMFLYSSGVVHRDISPGNILFSKKDGEVIAKLCDLEYAKDMTADNPANRPQDVKIGTPFFMAVEIEAGTLLFEPEFEPGSVDIEDFFETVCNRVISPLRYRYLHDLESIFWVLVYFLFITHPSEDKLDDELRDSRLRNCYSLFTYPTDGLSALPRAHLLKGITSTIRRTTSHFPSKLKMALRHFLAIGFDLRKEYERVESNPMDLAIEEPVRLYQNAQAYLGVLVRSVKDGVWLGDVVRLDKKTSAGDKPGDDDDGSSAKKARHE